MKDYKYTVYEYITGERYYTKYGEHDELTHVLPIKNCYTEKEAKELCKEDNNLLIAENISDEELKEILDSYEYNKDMREILGIVGY